jgi:hypothetical protein
MEAVASVADPDLLVGPLAYAPLHPSILEGEVRIDTVAILDVNLCSHDST